MHLPLLPAQAAQLGSASSLDLTTQCRGVEIVLRTAIDTPIDLPEAGGTLA
jgi:pyrrolidone-carboxylate peptidase